MSLRVEAVGLARRFRVGPWGRRREIRAVDGVDLTVAPGEMVGIVGESGCGKSTLGRLLVGLDRPTAGKVRIDGKELALDDGPAFRRDRRRVQYVYQDPLSALNPRLTIGYQIAEALVVHGLPRDRAAGLLAAVGLGPEHGARHAHQLSGGQRQRAVLARTLAVEPRFVVFDEPVSALDLSVQAQIVGLIAEIRRRLGLTGVFISHDLRVVRYIADRIAVMYLGRIVEAGPADCVFHEPRHPYTRALLSALPSPEPGRPRQRLDLRGDPPDPAEVPSGCPFHPRCAEAMTLCRRTAPADAPLPGGGSAACHAVSARAEGRPWPVAEAA